MKKIISDFTKIDSEYLLISDKLRIEDNIEELFSLCKKHLGSEVRFLAPYFFDIIDWNKWDVKPIVDYRYFTYVDNLDFNCRLDIQNNYMNLVNVNGINGFILDYKKVYPSNQRISLCISNNEYVNPSNNLIHIKIDSHASDYKLLSEPEIRKTAFTDIMDESDLVFHDIKKTEVCFDQSFFLGEINPLIESVRAHSVFLPGSNRIYFIYSDIYSKNRDNGLDYSYGLGGLFVIIDTPLDQTEEQSFVRVLQSISDKVANRIIQGYYTRMIRNESIKSAKAAIMSRNMSHNLGSHVMAYLKQYLNSVKDMLDREVLYDLIPKVCEGNLTTDDIASNTELPFLVGLGRFLGYIQERQDYIATVATDYIPFIAPINFKDAIYDELNPDLRYARHKDDRNRPLNILLSYIAKSEGFSRQNESAKDIRIGFKSFNNDGTSCITFGYNSFDNAMRQMRSVSLGLPGGLIGRQALFSVLENIIRNAAKHGKHAENAGLDFIIDIIDGHSLKKDQLVNIDERISSETLQELFKSSKDIKHLSIITITDNIKISDDVIDSLRYALIEDYIDEDNKIIDTNKGIKEMRISASWLRHETDETQYNKVIPITSESESGCLVMWKPYENDVRRLKAPLISIEKSKDGFLRYIICVSKCREFIVVSDSENLEKLPVFREIVGKLSWKISPVEEFLEKDNDFDKSAEFIIVTNQNDYNKIRPFVSNRVVNLGEMTDAQKSVLVEAITSYDNSSNKPEHLSSLKADIQKVIYQVYTGFDNNSPNLYVYDSKTECDSHFDKIVLHKDETNVSKAEYIYRTHHATESQVSSYWKRKKNEFISAKRVEGVSGNDSSDRLVRREKLDEKWYYLHLNALNKRIAIFDERIFSNEHRVNENGFFEGIDGLEKIIQIVEESSNINDDIISSIRMCLKNCSLSDEDNNILDFSDTKEDILALLNRYSRTVTKQSKYSFKSIYHRERGVEIFTILRISEKHMGIFGFIGANEDMVCEYAKIGDIIYVNNECKVELSDAAKKDFDYICIHQGLLDKIYECFGIKQDREGKIEISKQLYKAFMSKVSPIGNYMPNLIIHSGRSKPTAQDMPQDQPFVQFAAIENGVKDCKYSLVELLDYSRYEK